MRANRHGWSSRHRTIFGSVLSVCLALVLLAANGVLPSPALITSAISAAAGERWMCQGGTCGCVSARECWTSCCCHTLQQRVEWARAEGVSIPSYVKIPRTFAAAPEPACPLCESPNAAIDPTGDEPSTLPTLSALACKGLQSLIAMAAPVSWAPPAQIVLPPLATAERPLIRTQTPQSRPLDVPAPPPRPSVA